MRVFNQSTTQVYLNIIAWKAIAEMREEPADRLTAGREPLTAGKPSPTAGKR